MCLAFSMAKVKGIDMIWLEKMKIWLEVTTSLRFGALGFNIGVDPKTETHFSV